MLSSEMRAQRTSGVEFVDSLSEIYIPPETRLKPYAKAASDCGWRLGEKLKKVALVATSGSETPASQVQMLPKGHKTPARFAEVMAHAEEALRKVRKMLIMADDVAEIRAGVQTLMEEEDSLKTVVKDMIDCMPKHDLDSFKSKLKTFEENVQELDTQALERIQSISRRENASRSRSSRSGHKRGSRSVSGISTSSSYSNKQVLNEAKKDMAIIKARLSFARQESDVKRKELELQSQKETLNLLKELAEKEAVAQECMKIERLENPFGIENDLAEADAMLGDIDPLPVQTAAQKVASFVKLPSCEVQHETVGLGINVQVDSLPDTVSNCAFSVLNKGSANVPACTVNVSGSGQNPVTSQNVNVSNAVDQNIVGASQSAVVPRNVSMSQSHPMSTVPRNRLPDIKVWVFDGDETEYQEWEASFKALIENRVSNIYEKMNLLKQHLGPKPLKMLKGFFQTNTEESYQKAVSGLKSRYGSSVAIGQCFLNRLKAWRRLKDDVRGALREFSDFLEHVAECKKTVSELNTLDFSSNHAYIVRKLPPALVDKWRGKVLKYKRKVCNESAYPPFDEFVEFVKERSDRKNLAELQILETDKYNNPRQVNSKSDDQPD